MSTASTSPTQRLADVLLGDDGPAERFIRSRRERKVSWRVIVRELYEATDRQVDITHETARAWSPDEPEVAEAAEARAS